MAADQVQAPSPDTNCPVDCLCLARGLATGPARPARPRGRLQRPARARVVRIGITVGQVGRSLLFDEHAAAGQQLHQAADDLVQHRLQPFIGGRGHFDQDRLTVSAPVDPIEHQAVQTDVQIGSRSEALGQRDRAAVGLLGLKRPDRAGSA